MSINSALSQQEIAQNYETMKATLIKDPLKGSYFRMSHNPAASIYYEDHKFYQTDESIARLQKNLFKGGYRANIEDRTWGQQKNLHKYLTVAPSNQNSGYASDASEGWDGFFSNEAKRASISTDLSLPIEIEAKNYKKIKEDIIKGLSKDGTANARFLMLEVPFDKIVPSTNSAYQSPASIEKFKKRLSDLKFTSTVNVPNHPELQARSPHYEFAISGYSSADDETGYLSDASDGWDKIRPAIKKRTQRSIDETVEDLNRQLKIALESSQTQPLSSEPDRCPKATKESVLRKITDIFKAQGFRAEHNGTEITLSPPFK